MFIVYIDTASPKNAVLENQTAANAPRRPCLGFKNAKGLTRAYLRWG